MLNKIPPLIITYNEAENINRMLQHLTWADTIVVIDSFTTDETLKILSRYPQIKSVKESLILLLINVIKLALATNKNLFNLKTFQTYT